MAPRKDQRPTTLAVGLLGYGTVGAAVHRLLDEQGDAIEAATGLRLRVVAALVRDPRKERDYPPGPGLLTTDPGVVLAEFDTPVVIEALGGLVPAHDYVRSALDSGRHVVTANKQLVATSGPDLAAVAAERGVVLAYEAAVGTSIPIVRVLRHGVPPRSVRSLTAVINGTTNYMIARMERGDTYDDALRAAQERGYAEPDPTDDVSGGDAAAKMTILARLAFAAPVRHEDARWEGIVGLTPAELAAARAEGKAVRLVGRAALDGEGTVRVTVGRELLDLEDPLARLSFEQNGVVVEGDGFGRLALTGPGAGGAATAAAIVTDLVEIFHARR